MVCSVQTAAVFGNLAVFGGMSNVRVLDMQKQEIFMGPLKTALTYNDSLQICRISSSEVLLTVVGSGPRFNSNESDVYNINELLKLHRISPDAKSFPESLVEEPLHNLCKTKVHIQNDFEMDFGKVLLEKGNGLDLTNLRSTPPK
jgi:hypothetical protein